MSRRDVRGSSGLSVRFDPGEAVAIVGPTAVCLVLDDPHSGLVTVLRERLEGQSGSDAALDEMVRTHGLDLPPFGLIAFEGDTARVVVRGQVGVTVETSEATQVLVGDRSRSWVDQVVDGVVSILVTADARASVSEPPAFDATSGLLPASRLEIRLDARPEPATGEALPPFQDGDVPVDPPSGPRVTVADVDAWTPREITDEQPDGSAVEDADGSAGQLDPSLPQPVPPPLPQPDPPLLPQPDPPLLPQPVPREAAEQVAVDHGATLIGPFDLGEDPSDEDPGGVAEATPPLVGGVDADGAHLIDGGAVPAVEQGDDYDHLFGATQYRTVEQAAVRPDDDGEPDDGPGDAGRSGGTGPMVSGVPTAGVDGSPWTAGGAEPDDHDGHTVSLASLRAQMRAATPTPGTTPSVHAVHCPSGHLNPTHAGTCRACGVVILDQEHVSVPRPVLGAIVFTDGREVPVSRPLLIGRAPKVDGVLSGEAPELVVVASPLKEVSSTHVELRLEGWQVLVVDRQSTNGTVVTSPGRDPQRLRPGEPVPITSGTTVSLADEVMFTFEVTG